MENTGRPVTIRDVAAKASVSLATVSAILNGSRANTRFSAATRQRVVDVARELGYRPNAIARALVQRSTNIVGLYFGYGHLEPHDPFHAEVLSGLQAGCEELRRDLLIHYSFHRWDTDEVFSELANGKIDGLVMIAAPNDPLVKRVGESSLHVVAMTDRIPTIPSVIADDAAGSRSIAEHLAERGHRVVLYRTCPGASDSAGRRYQAFVAAAEQLGMVVYSATTDDWKGGLSAEERDLLARRRMLGITAAVCWGDPSANALLKYCDRDDISVPGDLAVAGFNGIEPPVEPKRHITTIRAGWGQVANRAVHLLADLIEGREAPQLTVLPVHFVPGDTT